MIYKNSFTEIYYCGTSSITVFFFILYLQQKLFTLVILFKNTVIIFSQSHIFFHVWNNFSLVLTWGICTILYHLVHLALTVVISDCNLNTVFQSQIFFIYSNKKNCEWKNGFLITILYLFSNVKSEYRNINSNKWYFDGCIQTLKFLLT